MQQVEVEHYRAVSPWGAHDIQVLRGTDGAAAMARMARERSRGPLRVLDMEGATLLFLAEAELQWISPGEFQRMQKQVARAAPTRLTDTAN